MTLHTLFPLFLLALVAFAPSAATAKATKTSVAKIWPAYSALALDANGLPQIAYQSPDHLPFHAPQAGKKFGSALVDDRPDAGWDPALGVDPQGHVHMAYHAERMLPSYAQKLVYAFSDGGPWQTEDVDDGGYGTSLALDADDHAHLLYADGFGNLTYAQQEDAGWELHATGLSANWFRTTGLALDAAGDAHACYARNGGPFGVETYYATNAEGDWQETLLGMSGGDLCSLALDGDGHPWVAVLTAGDVLLFHHDGMTWSEEAVLDLSLQLPGFSFGPDGIALALDADGRAFLIATFFASAGGRGAEIQLFLAHDGEEWRAALLGSKDEGFDPVLRVALDGTLHGIWRSGGQDQAKLSYFTASFPDLSGRWGGVSASGAVVSGTLTIENQGNDKAKSAPIALYLSSDGVLDPGDTLLPGKRKVGGLKPGAQREVAVVAELAGPASGLYLIAVIDPEKSLDDLDRSDNTVAALIP